MPNTITAIVFFLLLVAELPVVHQLTASTSVWVRNSTQQNWVPIDRWQRSVPTTPNYNQEQQNNQVMNKDEGSLTTYPLQTRYTNRPRRQRVRNSPSTSSSTKRPRTRYQPYRGFEYSNWRHRRQSGIPPWYESRYRPYQQDDPGASVSPAKPWSYLPKCRSCGRPLLQDSYCSDDFVILAFVYKNIATTAVSRHYLVYVYEVFKDNRRRIRAMQYQELAYSCDQVHSNPVPGATYLITGIYRSNEATIDSCSWKSNWNQVTPEQKRYLKRAYRLSCSKCRIERVFVKQPTSSRPDTCQVAIGPNPNELPCTDKFSLCRRKRHNQRCSFTSSPSYSMCLKWLSPTLA